MADHSIIPPSSASRRVQCNGSAVMELMHPELKESDSSREGTASHELAERMLHAATRANLEWPSRDEVIDKPASNGVIWDSSSYNGAEMYAEDVRQVMQSTAIFTPHIEERVVSPSIHPESWGTPDCWLFDPKTMTIYIWDYKFGFVLVEVTDNHQMTEYVAGILDQLGIPDTRITVVFTIVQPRAYHRNGPIRRWEVRGSDLRGAINILHGVEHACLGPDPTFNTGAECYNCSARYVCDLFQSKVYTGIEYSGKAVPTPLDNRSLGIELAILDDVIKTLESRKKGLVAQAEEIIKQGGGVFGQALEPGRGKLEWSVDKKEVYLLGDMMGVDLRKDEPITATQAKEKLKKSGIDESVINTYSEKRPGKLSLVTSDKTAAHAVFAKRN